MTARATPLMDAVVHAIEDLGSGATATAINKRIGSTLPAVYQTLHRLEKNGEVNSHRRAERGPIEWELRDDDD